MSILLSHSLCEDQWKSVMLDLLKILSSQDIIKRHAGTIVVIDPDTYTHNGGEGTVLFTADVDKNHDDADKFRTIALRKAAQSCRTGLSGRELVGRPHFYKRPLNPDVNTDTKYMGGVIHEGLVVAFSGVQAHYDEFIATTFAALLVADCRDMYAEINVDEPFVTFS